MRWKLTLNYTAVTVGVLLVVELVFYLVAAIILAVSINTGYLQSQLIEFASTSFSPRLRYYLSNSSVDSEEISLWLEGMRPPPNTIGVSFQDTDGVILLRNDGELLAISPPDYVKNAVIGEILDPKNLPGLTGPLQSALTGEKNSRLLFSQKTEDNNIVMTVPIWDEPEKNVLGVLVLSAAVPTVNSLVGDMLPVLGYSLLFFTLAAGLIGTAFGFFAARGFTRRLNRLEEAASTWSQGDFTVSVDDRSEDELGKLAQHLNRMADQLQLLFDTRRELTVVEERNRIARDLHDSVKQLAFAAAAQISAARKMLEQGQVDAESHVKEAEQLIYALRKELTGLIQELRPAALDGKGLSRAVRDYAADWSRQNEITLDVRIQHEQTLPLFIEQNVFRLIQEALSNIARHSQANRAEIDLIFAKENLTCNIRDNGIGFEGENNIAGFGFRSMQDRLDEIGGHLAIESMPGKGTLVSFNVPWIGSHESEDKD